MRVLEVHHPAPLNSLAVDPDIQLGKLVKNLSHLNVNFTHPKKNVVNIELHHGQRKNVATLRTVRSIINNLIIGVTKGFKYKMRYVYAHFPINVNIEKNKESDLYEVDIRSVLEECGAGEKSSGLTTIPPEIFLARRSCGK